MFILEDAVAHSANSDPSEVLIIESKIVKCNFIVPSQNLYSGTNLGF